jgi:MFS family permease
MASVTTSSATLEMTAPAERRWLVLVVAAVAQLMLVLDGTIVNIALPSAQQALGFSDADRQWVVTAYALAFGSLLLVDGRLGVNAGGPSASLARSLPAAAPSG